MLQSKFKQRYIQRHQTSQTDSQLVSNNILDNQVDGFYTIARRLLELQQNNMKTPITLKRSIKTHLIHNYLIFVITLKIFYLLKISLEYGFPTNRIRQ